MEGGPVPSTFRIPPGLAIPDGIRGAEEGPGPGSAQVRSQWESGLLDGGRGEVRVRPCGSEGPACLHPGPRLQPHLRPYSPLFIMFQLDRPSVPQTHEACSWHWTLCLPRLHLLACFLPRSMHSQLLLFIPVWAQKHLPQAFTDLLIPSPTKESITRICHLYVTHHYQEVCFLFPGLGCPPLSNDDLLFYLWFTRFQPEPDSLREWNPCLLIIGEFENNLANFPVLLSGGDPWLFQRHLRILRLHFRARVCELWPMGQTSPTTCFYFLICFWLYWVLVAARAFL